jgi:hypothetical protein
MIERDAIRDHELNKHKKIAQARERESKQAKITGTTTNTTPTFHSTNTYVRNTTHTHTHTHLYMYIHTHTHAHLDGCLLRSVKQCGHIVVGAIRTPTLIVHPGAKLQVRTDNKSGQNTPTRAVTWSQDQEGRQQQNNI